LKKYELESEEEPRRPARHESAGGGISITDYMKDYESFKSKGKIKI
jgi:hypothetical protein